MTVNFIQKFLNAYSQFLYSFCGGPVTDRSTDHTGVNLNEKKFLFCLNKQFLEEL